MKIGSLAAIIGAVMTWGLAAGASAQPLPADKIPMTAAEIAALQTRANAGDVFAAELMGQLYYRWAGMKPDYVKAAQWFHKAADGGDTQAPDFLAKIDAFTAQHAVLYAAAQSGDAKALYDFGQHEPHNATGLEGDAPKEHWFLLSARKGYGPAELAIGTAYFGAYYRRRWEAEDAKRKTARGGEDGDYFGFDYVTVVHRQSDVAVGFEGEGPYTDLPNAKDWLEKGVQAGSAEAEYWLALAYGVEGPDKADMARDWLFKSADDGAGIDAAEDACELAFTGGMARMPVGSARVPIVRFDGPRDYARAFGCYSRQYTSKIGVDDDVAAFSLGYMYHRGLGVSRDDARALALLQPLADGDGEYHYDADYELSLLYRDSPTIKHDLGKAYLLLAEAAEADNAAPQTCGGMDYRSIRHVRRRSATVAALRRDRDKLFQGFVPARGKALDDVLERRGIYPHPGVRPVPVPPPVICVS